MPCYSPSTLFLKTNHSESENPELCNTNDQTYGIEEFGMLPEQDAISASEDDDDVPIAILLCRTLKGRHARAHAPNSSHQLPRTSP